MSLATVPDKEDRRLNRVPLALPIRIEVKVDRAVEWSEITRISDVSAFGAGFNLKRPVKRGRLMKMTVPMPRQLRSYDYMEPQYLIWGIVRRCIPINTPLNGESYAHGVAFIGKNPPKSYLENPARLYELSDRDENGLWHIANAPDNPDESHLPPDLRRHSRFHIPVTVTLEMLDHDGNVTATESSVTENLSLGGAAVFTTLDVQIGSFLRVKSEQYNAEIISVVRGKRTSVGGIYRLHIEFIDHFFPLEING